MAFTKVPDATPGVVSLYALGDEQALLARVRYNRLIDIFIGCGSFASAVQRGPGGAASGMARAT